MLIVRFIFMPQNKKRKSNKLRNYLLGVGAAGLTGLGAYTLLKNKKATKLIANSPVTVPVEKIVDKKLGENPITSTVEKKLLKRTRTSTRPTESTPNFKPQEKITHRPIEPKPEVGERRTRKRTKAQTGEKKSVKGESKLQKFLRNRRYRYNSLPSNISRAFKGKGKRPLRDALEKQTAFIDVNSFDGTNIKGKLPPTSPTLNDVIPPKGGIEKPNISPISSGQKLLPPASSLPNLNKQLTRITVKPFYRNGKLVKSYKRNMLTNIRQQKLQELRKTQVKNIIQDLKTKQLNLNDPKLKQNLQQQIDELNHFLTNVSYDTPMVKRLKNPKRRLLPKPTPPNPSEVTNKQLQTSDVFAHQENIKQTTQAQIKLEESKNKAVHIKTEIENIDYISQQAREKVRSVRQIRANKRHQIEFQPERRSQILEALNGQIRATQRFARNLDDQVKRRLVKRKSIETTYNEIVNDLKNVTIPTFNKELNTVANDVKINKFKEDFDNYLNDPFSDLNHFDNVKDIKTLNDQIDSEIIWAKSQLKEPNKRLMRVKDGLKRIQSLRKLYEKNLTDVTKLNGNELTKINLNIDNVINELSSLNVDDVGEEFFKNELPEILKSLKLLRNGDSQTYMSSFIKKLNKYEIKLKDLETNFDKKIRSKEFNQLKDYINRLNEQKLKLQELPLTKRKLTSEQRLLLKNTEIKRKELESIFDKFETTKGVYIEWFKSFNSTFDKSIKNIEKVNSYVEGGGILNSHLTNVEDYVKQMTNYFNESKKQLSMLDKLMSPESYLEYFDGGIVNESDKVTLSQMMTKKRDLIKGSAIINGKVVKRPSLFKQLLGYDVTRKVVEKNDAGEVIGEKLKQEHIFGSLESIDYAIKRMKTTTKPDKVISGLDESFAKIDDQINELKKSIVSLEKLKQQYTVKQVEILKQLEKDYNDVLLKNPEYKEILNIKIETLRKNIKSDVATYDQLFKVYQLQAENAIETLKSYKKINPIFNIEKVSKVGEISDNGLSLRKTGNVGSSDSLYDYELTAEINPNTLVISPKDSKEIPTYKQPRNRKRIDTTSLENWVNSAKEKIKNYRTKKRVYIANLYWDLQNNKIKTEGEGNIFDQIRKGNLGEIEQRYYDAIPDEYRKVLDEYSRSGLDELFQDFYYKNSIRKYLLNLQTKDVRLLPPDVQKEIAQKNNITMLEIGRAHV